MLLYCLEIIVYLFRITEVNSTVNQFLHCNAVRPVGRGAIEPDVTLCIHLKQHLLLRWLPLMLLRGCVALLLLSFRLLLAQPLPRRLACR
jgi:hypothetical protein